MKAMRAPQFGGPEQLRFEAHPIPRCKPDRCVSRFELRGSTLPLPYIPGTDVCREVEAAGGGVGHVKKGDRIFGRALGGGYGGNLSVGKRGNCRKRAFVAERFAAGCLDAFRSGVLKAVPDRTSRSTESQ